jgi:hypothetical protein
MDGARLTFGFENLAEVYLQDLDSSYLDIIAKAHGPSSDKAKEAEDCFSDE